MKSASNFGFNWPINSCARSRRPWNSSGVMGCTRSPSGCKEEKLAGVCVSAVDPGGAASVIVEAAAVEYRNLRREISCAGFPVKFIGKEEWLLNTSDVKNLEPCRRKSRTRSSECQFKRTRAPDQPMRYFANADS